jgi:Asp-tRNA(Asn)/Glu-tRNA(Gln) amidotransferase A subunit family amidase
VAHATRITSFGASELAEKLRRRELGAVEVLDAYHAALDRVDPELRAVVARMERRSRADALAAERALARGEGGALCGVPFTINDAFDTAGVPTTGGSRLYAQRVPARDAIAVERLCAAGALPLAKSNLPEFGLNYDCGNPLFGETRNPFDPSRTPGGSCGGEAALLAARLSPLGLGKDAAGSVRVPSHFCGTVGLMPTPGRIPLTGLFPDAIRQYVVNGVMARCCDDVWLGLRALAGYDPRDPSSLDAAFGDPDSLALRGLRIAVGNPGGAPVARAITARVAAAARALAAEGAVIEEVAVPAAEAAQQVFWPILMLEGSYYADSAIPPDRWDEVDPEWRERREFMRSLAIDARALTEARFRRLALQAEARVWLESHPILLAPCYATTAFARGARELDVDGLTLPMLGAGAAATWANFMALPSLVVPAGLAEDGLPVGVQLVGRPFREHELVAVGRALERALGGCPVPRISSLA